MMQLGKALAAFYTALFNSDCEHPRVAPRGEGNPHTSFCPDCGYKVKAMWSVCRCRTCGSKRHPKRSMDGRVSPLYRYCQHCGQTDFQLIKKDRINVHEMPYALLTKDVDYTEERQASPKRPSNPFEAAYRTLDIVEGEVLHRSEEVLSNSKPRNHFSDGFYRS